MALLVLKALLSGLVVAAASEAARRSATIGALIVSLPLVALLSVIWLWRDTHEPSRIATQMQATFWYVLPSLPMFLVVPSLLRRGLAFWPALGFGCLLTIGLYFLLVWAGGKAGLRL